jgi:PAS domain S-box-containing protein
MLRLICLLLALWASTGTAQADALGEWRQGLLDARQAVENDVPASWQKVELLRQKTPTGLTDQDLARLLILRSRVLLMLSEVRTALPLAREALEQARKAGDKAEQADAHLVIGLIGLTQGDLALERQSVQDALTKLDGVNRPDLLAEAMLRAALHYWRSLQQDAAVTMAMQTMDIAQRSGDPWALVHADRALGVLHQLAGRHQEAVDYFEHMRNAARFLGSRVQESYAMEGMAASLRTLDRVAEAETLLSEVLDLKQKLGSPFNMAIAFYGYADLLQLQQRHSEAVQLLDQALAIYRQHPNPLGMWWALHARGSNLLRLGRLAAADADAQAALAIGKQAGLAFMKAESTKRLGAIAAAQGDHRRAYDLLAEADKLQNERDQSQTSERMLELTQRYRADSQQRQIDELKVQEAQSDLQMRWLWTVFAASVVLLGLTAYILMRQQRNNAQLANLNTQLQQSRNQLQATIQAIPDPLFVVDLEGRYLDVHASRPELLAAPAEELLGRKLSDFKPPAVAEACMNGLRRAHETGAVVTGLEIELPLETGNRWFELSIAPKRGRPLSDPRFVAMSRDITDRKRAEQQLHASEQMFRAIVEHSPDIIVRLDNQCRRIYINPAMTKLAGVEPSRLLGKTPLEALMVDTPEARSTAQLAEDSVREVIRTGKTLERETFWGVVNGRRLHFYTLYAPEFDQHGNVTGVVSVARDVRELKEKELNLEASRNMLRVLAARRDSAREEERKRIAREIHDELGQMLTAFRLDVATLKFEHGAKDPAIAQRCQKLIDMTDQTIQVVRNIASALRPASLDMGMSAALEWLSNEFQVRTGVQCRLHVGPALDGFTEEQSTAVFRIVQESLTNVARYAQARQVDISLRESTSGYVMAIKDDGKGFDPDGVRGRSFGLVGIRERALMLGGDVRIDSRPGQGTTVEVVIPSPRGGRRLTA